MIRGVAPSSHCCPVGISDEAYGGIWNVLFGTEIDLAFRVHHSATTYYLHAVLGPLALVLCQTEHAPQEDILARARGSEAEVLQSSVGDLAQELALTRAKGAFATSHDFSGVAETVTKALADASGGIWRCVVGVDAHLALQLRHGEEAYLEASFGELRMVVFKAGSVTEADIIAAARDSEPLVRSSTVPEGVEPLALKAMSEALQARADLNGIAEEVKHAVCKAFGGLWHLLLGMDAHFGAAIAPACDAYLECAFGGLEMVLFQAAAAEQADLIAAARGRDACVRKATVPEKVQQRAVESATQAVQKHSTFTTIAEAVRDDLLAAFGGSWQCSVGVDGVHAYGLRLAERAFIEICFGELHLVIFKAGHAAAAEIIAAAASADVEIVKSTVAEEIEEGAMEKIKLELGTCKDFASLCSAVHEHLSKMDGSGWQCLAGLGVNYACRLSEAKDAWLDLRYGDVRMVIFKASQKFSASEVMVAAKTMMPVVRKSTVTKAQQARAIKAALNLLGEHQYFGDVAKAIREDFIEQYGGVWHVVIAVAEHAGFSVWPASEGYLNVLFGEVEMILFSAYSNWF